MLRDNLACGVTLAARMKAREGEFHGLMLDCCFCPPGSWRGVRWRTNVLRREGRYHSGFSKSQKSLILFCKEFQNGTNLENDRAVQQNCCWNGAFWHKSA